MNDYIRLPRSALCDELWRNKDLAALLCYLLAHADGNGEFQSSLTTIAAELKITPQQFKTLWKKLEDSQVATKLATKLPTKLATKFILNIQTDTRRGQPSKQRSNQPSKQPSSNQVKPALDSFVDPRFAEAWTLWLEYRKEIKNSYKSEQSRHIGYKKFLKLSQNDPAMALEIVNTTIANGWKGLFPERNNGTKPITATDNAASRKAQRDRGLSLAATIVAGSENLLSLYNGGGDNPDARQD